eukprot:scaffold1341_cov178-Amphora_coffeaeformis.AAC.26
MPAVIRKRPFRTSGFHPELFKLKCSQELFGGLVLRKLRGSFARPTGAVIPVIHSTLIGVSPTMPSTQAKRKKPKEDEISIDSDDGRKLTGRRGQNGIQGWWISLEEAQNRSVGKENGMHDQTTKVFGCNQRNM